jgi:hypothetical protein
MAKKVTGTAEKNTIVNTDTGVKAVTDVRHSSVPPKGGTTTSQTNTNKTVNKEQIAKRAYEIWASGKGGSQLENWLRAEKELRGGW